MEFLGFYFQMIFIINGFVTCSSATTEKPPPQPETTTAFQPPTSFQTYRSISTLPQNPNTPLQSSLNPPQSFTTPPLQSFSTPPQQSFNTPPLQTNDIFTISPRTYPTGTPQFTTPYYPITQSFMIGTQFSAVPVTTQFYGQYTTASPPIFTTAPFLPMSTQEVLVDAPTHVQIIYFAVYALYPTNLTLIRLTLAQQINRMINTPGFESERITDITIRPTENDGELLFNFLLLNNTNSTTTSREAAKAIENAVTRNTNTPIEFTQDLSLIKTKLSCYWTDYGRCPNTPCTGGNKCFSNYNCISYCAKSEKTLADQISSSNPTTSTTNNNNLLGLIAIPVFLLLLAVIVITVLVVIRRPYAKKSAIELNEFGYANTTSKYGTGTMRRQGGMTIAEPGIRNKVYSTMGRTFEMGWDMQGNPQEEKQDNDENEAMDGGDGYDDDSIKKF